MESIKNFPLLTLQNINYVTLNDIYRSTQLNSVLVKGHLNLVEHVDGVTKHDLFFFFALQRISLL